MEAVDLATVFEKHGQIAEGVCEIVQSCRKTGTLEKAVPVIVMAIGNMGAESFRMCEHLEDKERGRES